MKEQLRQLPVFQRPISRRAFLRLSVIAGGTTATIALSEQRDYQTVATATAATKSKTTPAPVTLFENGSGIPTNTGTTLTGTPTSSETRNELGSKPQV